MSSPRVQAGDTWGGWYVLNRVSTDGERHAQRVHILTWGQPTIVRAIDEGQTPNALPLRRPVMVNLSELYHGWPGDD